ncbi:hypothetical protein NUW54_g8235 [Trametes sanguinea]|uniref:Uncharacterized protein n=1 Tax=Trametes sanguinea TaxID=158606 RepID=A0ACC1PGP5_9APHY|nr:hypothetical protein NUW54_g8235 [Trametes sanguinea]
MLLDLSPNIFNDVEVRRRGRPGKNEEVLVFEPLLNKVSRVLRVVIVLEDDGVWAKPMVTECTQEGLLEDVMVHLGVHGALDPVEASDPTRGDASPDSDFSSASRNTRNDVPSEVSLAFSSSRPLPSRGREE